MLEWIASPEYTTNYTDTTEQTTRLGKNQITQNETVRFLYTE
jgi:hypothetical protein